MKANPVLTVASFVLLAGICLPLNAQSVSYQTVSISNQKAPNTLSNVFYNGVDNQPWLTEGTLTIPGRAVIRSTLTGPGVSAGTNDIGLWEGPIDNLSLLARTGDNPPGTTPGVTYASFDPFYRNASGGAVAFGASLSGTVTSSDSGIWYRENPLTTPDLIAREGDPISPLGSLGSVVPVRGADGAFFPGYDIADIAGTVFIAANAGPGNTPVLLAGVPGDLTLVAYRGGPVPGTQSGVNYAALPVFERYVKPNPARDFILVRQFNQGAQMAYRAALSGSGITVDNDTGIWSGLPKGIALFAREGTQAAGLFSGVSYGDFPDSPSLAPLITQDGTVSFIGALIGTGVSALNNRGIWSGVAGDVPSLILRSGSQAPGTATGVLHNDFLQFTSANENWLFFHGRLAGSGVTGGNDETLYAGQNSTFTLVARENFDAPGTAAVFDTFSSSRLRINSAGFLVFSGRLKGAGVNTNNDEGLWAGTPGSIRLIAREGDPVPETPPGTTYGANFFDTFLLNEANEVAFSGVTGSSSSGPSAGIWALNQEGNVVLVGRQGSQLPKDDSRVGFVQNDLSNAIALLDNRGGIEFPVTFTDGDTAVIVAKLKRPPSEKAAKPTFDPIPGSYLDAQTIEIDTTTPEAGIRYTVDGTKPNVGSNLYTAPFKITSTTTVRAFAFKDGFKDSDEVSVQYVISPPSLKAAAPIISPNGGTFSGTRTVTLATSTPLATIRYTTNGANPVTDGQIYEGPFTLSANATVRAYATQDSFAASNETSATFIINPRPQGPTVLKITTPRRVTTTTGRTIIAGVASSPNGIDRVEYQINNRGPYIKASGTTQWQIRLRVRTGRTTLNIRAYSKLNVVSPIQTATVTFQF